MLHDYIVLLSILVLLQPSDAIKCYECNSSIDQNCKDPFTSTSIVRTDCHNVQLNDSVQIKDCRKMKYNENNETVYVRSCNTRKTMSGDYDHSFCDTDLCNSVGTYRPTTLTILLLTTLTFFKLWHV